MLPLKDTQGSGKFPFWVILLILLNAFVFFLELSSGNPDSLISKYALIPSHLDFSHPQTLFSLLSYQFLHAGFIHIISNMLFLWVFGDNVEAELGFFKFPVFYLSSGVIGALVQYFLMPNSGIAMLGASGAIAGVLGYYYASFPHHKIKTVIFIFIFFTIIDIPAAFILLYWFIIQLFSGAAALSVSASLGGVAFFAHIGGFVFGVLINKLFFKQFARLPGGA